MKFLRVALAQLTGLSALSLSVFGQAPSSDAQLAASVASVQKQYTASFADAPYLFNGPEYVDYAMRYPVRRGHQFFGVPEKQPGSVYYNGQLFSNLLLAYDVALDQVVVPLPNSPLTFRLVNEKVAYFQVNDHRFVRLVADSASYQVLRTGYYEVLLDSRVQLLAKRTKRLQEQIVQQRIEVDFKPGNRLFINKAGVYYPINKKGDATRLYSDKNKEVREYLKERKLSFGKAAFEASMLQLAEYYCSLPAR
jgi:hypothetical protein